MPEPPHVKRLSRALAALDEVADPLRRLDAARQAREQVERVELDAVAASRGAGKTWTEIGALYGLTKQGAQQRFQRAGRADGTGPKRQATPTHDPHSASPSTDHPATMEETRFQ